MKLRILEVLASLRRAGAERMVVSLARGLDRSRFETEVVSLYDAFPGGFEPVLEEGGIAHRHLGKHSGFDPRMFGRLRAVVQDFRPDLVHTHSYVMRYSLTCGAPHMVHTVHNVAEKEVDRVGRMIHRVAFRRRVAAVAVSDRVAESFHRVYGMPPAATIANGIDLTGFGEPSNWRFRNGFGEHDLLLVSVARLEPQKNPLGLLEAFAPAPSGTHLLLVGDGSMRAAAERKVTELGLAGRAHFLGVRNDIPELLAACDLFVLAAHWEGSPLAVIEAMASGLPVLATAVGGVPELVEDGVSGRLLPPGDTAAFSSAIAELTADADLRRRMGARGRERARMFSAERMVAAYAGFFERLTGRSA